ncbi:MAG: sugar ABC transporter permease [Oscillospiraceae bacterium]|nr:sugar ABC transporter permease [Oscillospiraceae bacterium]
MKKFRVNKNYWGYICIAPFFILFCIFSAYPLLSTFFYAWTDRDTYDNTANEVSFVGFDNFYRSDVAQFPVVLDPETGKVKVDGASSPREVMTDEETGKQYVLLPFDETKYFLEHNTDGSMYVVSKQMGGVFGIKLLRNSFVNTPILWLMGFIPQIVIALLLAALFTDIRVKIRGTRVFKVLFYMPNIMTAATISALFIVLVTNGGFIHQIAVATGYVKNATTPITGIWFTRGVIAFINFWLWFGNTMIVLIAAMLSVDKARIEAAIIDGATRNQIFWNITIPSIKPVILFTLIQSLVGGLQMFDVPSLMGAGVGGAFNADGTRTIMTSIHQIAFSSKNMGLAAAMSVVLFTFTAICSITIFLFMRTASERRDERLIKQFKKAEAKQKQTRAGGNVV